MNTTGSKPKTESSTGKQLWIGLIELRSRKPGNAILEDTKGAFVNLITWAVNTNEFRRNADLIASKLGLFVVDVENCEPVEARRRNGDVVLDDEIEDMISRAAENPNAIIYGTFHTFEKDDT